VLPPGQIAPPPLTVAMGSAFTVTDWVHVLMQPLELVTVRVSVKEPAAPAVTAMDCVFVAPTMEPSPEMDQR
jgi:hypothetical protein